MITKEDVYDIIPKEILKEMFKDFKLNIDGGIHGFSHWARVVDNGLEICENNGANPKVIITFGLFHDVKRENDEEDPEHGYRGGQLLSKYRDSINLTDYEIEKVIKACEGHTHEMHNDDLDIGTCWDADRLDLYRVGVYPSEEYLNNEYCKNDDIIDEISERAEYNYMSEWAIDLNNDIIIPMLKKQEENKVEKLKEEMFSELDNKSKEVKRIKNKTKNKNVRRINV